MKKNVSLILIVLLILSSFATVSAGVVEIARAWYCDCGGEVTLRNTTTGSWRNIGIGDCPHGNIDHHAILQERTVIRHYECNNCSIEEDIVFEETRTICN